MLSEGPNTAVSLDVVSSTSARTRYGLIVMELTPFKRLTCLCRL